MGLVGGLWSWFGLGEVVKGWAGSLCGSVWLCVGSLGLGRGLGQAGRVLLSVAVLGVLAGSLGRSQVIENTFL